MLMHYEVKQWIPAARYGEAAICEHCHKPMMRTFGSGRFCSSHCSHSHVPWNRGKTLGPDAAKRGWEKRKQGQGYEAECRARAERMKSTSRKYWKALRADPLAFAARNQKIKNSWAAKRGKNVLELHSSL